MFARVYIKYNDGSNWSIPIQSLFYSFQNGSCLANSTYGTACTYINITLGEQDILTLIFHSLYKNFYIFTQSFFMYERIRTVSDKRNSVHKTYLNDILCQIRIIYKLGVKRPLANPIFIVYTYSLLTDQHYNRACTTVYAHQSIPKFDVYLLH